jgi:hypothetical protein
MPVTVSASSSQATRSIRAAGHRWQHRGQRPAGRRATKVGRDTQLVRLVEQAQSDKASV